MNMTVDCVDSQKIIQCQNVKGNRYGPFEHNMELTTKFQCT